MGLRAYTKEDCEGISAALGTGDQFMNPCAIKELETYIAIWQRGLEEFKDLIEQEKDED